MMRQSGFSKPYTNITLREQDAEGQMSKTSSQK